jgi:2-aminoadipate transaminase
MISLKAEHTLKQVNPVNELLNVTEGMISFAGGLPSTELVNSDHVLGVLKNVLKQEIPSIFQYGEIEGNGEFRKLLSKWVQRYGINTNPHEILITSGGTQAIEILTEFFIDPGDYIFVDQYSFVSAIEIFKSYKANVISVESDENGIILECLESKLKKYSPKFIYIVTNYNNPTGYSLSKERRKRMVEIIKDFDTIIIEDDPYIELYYNEEFIKPIKSLEHSQVIYISSFSKIISPGLRVGYIISNEEIIRKIRKLKENKDIHTSNLSQFIVLQVLKGDFDSYLDKLRSHYKTKRDFMIHCLDVYLNEHIQYNVPAGGMFLWIAMKEEINISELLNLALNKGISFIPGHVFCADSESGTGNYIRLNFTNPEITQMKIGIERIGDCIEGLHTSLLVR